MTTWTTKPLGDVVAQMKTGSTPSTSRPEFFKGSIPWFTPGDIGRSRDLVKSSRTITKEALSTGKAKLFDEHTLLVTCIGNIGRVGVLQQKSSSNQQITALKFPDEIDPYFAYYWFIFNQHKLESFANIAVVPILNNERMSDISFSYPPISEQKRFAAQLAQADRLRQLRRNASQLGESYLQSAFLAMFYSKENRNWPKVTIEEIVKKGKNKIRTGPFGSDLKHSEFVDEGVFVLGIDNAVNNRFEIGRPRYITEKKYEQLKRYTVFPDDVLITIMATLGRCAIVPENFPKSINTKHLCCITLDQSKCLPIYLQQCFLRHPQVLEQLGVSERGAVMPGLNMGLIKDLVLPLPPLPEQERFAKIVARYEKLRAQMRESTRQAEMLFQGLLYESFGKN